jgi:hypothetical protein
LPVRLASVPAPVAVPRAKKARTVCALPAFVHVHVLPVSDAVTVFADDVLLVRVSDAVAGSHVSVPRSDAFVVAFARSFVKLRVKVPVVSLSLRPASVPDALAAAPAIAGLIAVE